MSLPWREEMRALGFVWSAGADHFYRDWDEERVVHLVEHFVSGWRATAYIPTGSRDWVSPVPFENPVAAAVDAECRGWGDL